MEKITHQNLANPQPDTWTYQNTRAADDSVQRNRQMRYPNFMWPRRGVGEKKSSGFTWGIETDPDGFTACLTQSIDHFRGGGIEISAEGMKLWALTNLLRKVLFADQGYLYSVAEFHILPAPCSPLTWSKWDNNLHLRCELVANRPFLIFLLPLNPSQTVFWAKPSLIKTISEVILLHIY